MHQIQEKLLNLASQHDLGQMSLRSLAKLVGVQNKPQIVKHHLLQLDKKGLLQVNLEDNVIKPIKRGFNSVSSKARLLFSLPIVGTANCGPATVFADERVEGFLKVSTSLLPHRKKDLFVLVADGPSMNKAEVDPTNKPGVTIEDGDYLVVDSADKTPKNRDIVVAVIDGLATIKRFRNDVVHNRFVLEADSTEKYHPIFIAYGDDFEVSGKVIDVIKK